MVEGGVVPVVVSIDLGREKVVLCIPISINNWTLRMGGNVDIPGSFSNAEDMSLMQASHSRGTEKVAS